MRNGYLRTLPEGPILHTSHSCISQCPNSVGSSTARTTRMLETETGFTPIFHHTPFTHPKATSSSFGSHGAEGEHPLDNLP